jgi:hypothetical protein
LQFSVILYYKQEIDWAINFPSKMTEKRQISQGYIIRILQHFATKLWNITNFAGHFLRIRQWGGHLQKGTILYRA